ncbi:GNAT family N-acetyltransferase [Enterococcus faecium]
MDTIINLYADRTEKNLNKKMNNQITLLRPLPLQKNVVVDFIKANFCEQWAVESEVAFCNVVPTIFVAILDSKMVEFCCYNATSMGFLSPIGVVKKFRGMNIGFSLVNTTLDSMKVAGYAHTIVGSCSNALQFYTKNFGAQVIESSKNNSIYDKVIS